FIGSGQKPPEAQKLPEGLRGPSYSELGAGKVIAVVPVRKPFEEVLAELRRLNLGFTGKHGPPRAEGGGLVLHLTGEKSLKTIAPLRALHPPVTHLHLDGTSVADLSPLRGMTSLRHLNCNGTPVEELSPLEDLRLTSLELNETKVKS